MRPKERIPVFLQKVDFDKLQKRWNVDISQGLRGIILKSETKDYWLENYDMRFGQMLINLEYMPDTMQIWTDEEYDILYDQGLPLREVLLWGNNYDKDMNRLPETIWRPICEMKTDHIQAILDGNWCKNPKYKETFEAEIILRNESKSNKA